MTQTYTMRIRTGESPMAIESEFGNIPHEKITKAMSMAILAFRSVEVTASETGEIIFSFYKDYNFFTPVYGYGEMLSMLCGICYGVD